MLVMKVRLLCVQLSHVIWTPVFAAESTDVLCSSNDAGCHWWHDARPGFHFSDVYTGAAHVDAAELCTVHGAVHAIVRRESCLVSEMLRVLCAYHRHLYFVVLVVTHWSSTPHQHCYFTPGLVKMHTLKFNLSIDLDVIFFMKNFFIK